MKLKKRIKKGRVYWFLYQYDQYLEKVDGDPDSWLQDEIEKATKAMNFPRVDELRKIQRRRHPGLKPTADNCHLDCRALETLTAADFPFGLPDAIITDPPYGQEYLAVYETLAVKAAEFLKPGGSLFVMVGQSYLPQIMESLNRHLTYQWVISYLTPGGQSAQLWARKVNTFWKPVLWYVRGEYDSHWIGDVVKSAVNDNDKRLHQWGQSESGMADLVKRVSKRGDVICDPFMGAGTTGKVCLDLGRRFVGFDKDRVAYETTCTRLGYVDARAPV